MNNLAYSLKVDGSVQESLELFSQVLRKRERTLSPDHPDILISTHNVALALANLGRADEARRSYEDVLSARERVLGPCHPDTVQTRRELRELPDGPGTGPL